MTHLAILAVLIFRTCGDVCFKAAVNHTEFTSIRSAIPTFLGLFKNIYIWLGLLFGTANVFMWGITLHYFDLSYAYPFLSLSFVTTMICGKILFHEHIGIHKVIGIVLIVLGAFALILS